MLTLIAYLTLIIYSTMLNLSVKYKEKTFQIQIQGSEPISSLKQKLQALTKIPAIQQQLSTTVDGKKVPYSDDSMPVSIAKITENTELGLKNLGSQIRWDYVFYIQYAGPLIVFPLLFLLGKRQSYNQIQYIALAMAILHFVKRELQTAYVHVFSRTSMPLKRVFINSVHYWVFFALCNGVQLYFFPDKHSYSLEFQAFLVLLWVTVEFCNFKCHTILSSFRKKKSKSQGEYVNQSKQRGIPFGWGFNFVSCANYFWEALGWIIFSVLTRTYMAYMFTFYSVYQMLQWAIKKHKNYKKQFGDKYPKGRKAMFPFII